MTRIFIIAATMLFATLSSAFAHHPLGGEVPTTAMHGLLSGIGHPIIGFDHLAFVTAVGLIAAFQSNRLVMPLGFVAGTVAGTMLTLAAVTLPFAEIVITGSVVGAGAVALRGKGAGLLPSTLLAAVAGLFHGWAYGAAVVGAEATPLLAKRFTKRVNASAATGSRPLKGSSKSSTLGEPSRAVAIDKR